MNKGDLENSLKVFTETRFYKTSENEKINIVKQFAKYFCEDNHLEYMEFKLADLERTTNGEFDSKMVQISINKNLFEDINEKIENNTKHKGCEILEHIFHEYAHYQQYAEYKDKPESTIYKELETPINDIPEFYTLQITERKANETAIKYLKKMYEIYPSKNLIKYIKELEKEHKENVKEAKKELRKQGYAKTEKQIIECLNKIRPYYKIINECADDPQPIFNRYKFRNYNMDIIKTQSNIERVIIKDKQTNNELEAYIKDNKCIIYNTCKIKETPTGEYETKLHQEEREKLINDLEQYLVARNNINKTKIEEIEIIPVNILYKEKEQIKIIKKYENKQINNTIQNNIINNLSNEIRCNEIKNYFVQKIKRKEYNLSESEFTMIKEYYNLNKNNIKIDIYNIDYKENKEKFEQLFQTIRTKDMTDLDISYYMDQLLYDDKFLDNLVINTLDKIIDDNKNKAEYKEIEKIKNKDEEIEK